MHNAICRSWSQYSLTVPRGKQVGSCDRDAVLMSHDADRPRSCLQLDTHRCRLGGQARVGDVDAGLRCVLELDQYVGRAESCAKRHSVFKPMTRDQDQHTVRY